MSEVSSFVSDLEDGTDKHTETQVFQKFEDFYMDNFNSQLLWKSKQE